MAQLILHINDVAAQIGEQPLLSSVGNLGTLIKRELQSALFTVVSETRHSSFLSLTDFTVTAASPLLPSFALPARTMQVKSVYYKDTLAPALPVLTKLLPRELQELTRRSSIGYAVVGSNVHIGQAFTRPFTATLQAYICPDISTLTDTDNLVLPDEVLNVVELVAASLVAVSYIDDLAAQRALQTRATAEVEQLRKRAGALRAPISWK
jgi:hypothetical protein